MSAIEALPSSEPEPHRGRVRRGPIARLVIAFIAVACISGAVGAVAATLVKSPAQVAAEAAPPERTVLTASIREGSVSQSLMLTGTVALGNQVTIPTPATGGLAAIVTKVPLAVGSSIGPGSVLIEVSDRPVIALPGEIPMLRDLHFGDAGPDVARLQDALRAVGQVVGDRSGTFGTATARALSNVYGAAGYQAPLDDSRRAMARQAELALLPNGASGRIVGIGAVLGQSAQDPLVSVTTAPPTVTVNVTQLDLAQIAVGGSVQLAAPFLASSTEATVSAIGVLANSQDNGFTAPVTVTPASELPTDAIGHSVQVTLEASSEAETGLVVPLSAVYSNSVGASSVELLDEDDRISVPVTLGRSGNGEVMITSDDPRIRPGARVVVGLS